MDWDVRNGRRRYMGEGMGQDQIDGRLSRDTGGQGENYRPLVGDVPEYRTRYEEGRDYRRGG